MPTIRHSPGLLRRSLDAAIAARQRQAQYYVDHLVLPPDADTLKVRGYNHGELAKRVGRWLHI